MNNIESLLQNMNVGLLPEHLSKAEVNLLKEKFGDHWFKDLGYYEPTYRKPRCLHPKKYKK